MMGFHETYFPLVILEKTIYKLVPGNRLSFLFLLFFFFSVKCTDIPTFLGSCLRVSLFTALKEQPISLLNAVYRIIACKASVE